MGGQVWMGGCGWVGVGGVAGSLWSRRGFPSTLRADRAHDARVRRAYFSSRAYFMGRAYFFGLAYFLSRSQCSGLAYF